MNACTHFKAYMFQIHANDLIWIRQWNRSAPSTIELRTPSAVNSGGNFRVSWSMDSFSLTIIRRRCGKVASIAVAWSPPPPDMVFICRQHSIASVVGSGKKPGKPRTTLPANFRTFEDLSSSRSTVVVFRRLEFLNLWVSLALRTSWNEQKTPKCI